MVLYITGYLPWLSQSPWKSNSFRQTWGAKMKHKYAAFEMISSNINSRFFIQQTWCFCHSMPGNPKYSWIMDSTPWILARFRILCQWNRNSGFLNRWAVLAGLQNKNFPHSGFHKQKFADSFACGDFWEEVWGRKTKRGVKEYVTSRKTPRTAKPSGSDNESSIFGYLVLKLTKWICKLKWAR